MHHTWLFSGLFLGRPWILPGQPIVPGDRHPAGRQVPYGAEPYLLHVSTHHKVPAVLILTHWGWVTHICIGQPTSTGSDNGLSPGRRQAIIWTNAGILLIGPLGTNFSEILIGIQSFSLKKISSAKYRPFCIGLNVLNVAQLNHTWYKGDLKPSISFHYYPSIAS